MLLLQLKHELWKLFGKKRTYIGFAAFLLTQNLVSAMFRFTRAARPMTRLLEENGYLAATYISALTIATIIMVLMAVFLLPLYVTLIGGDLVAKEAEDGTLRMILSRPISRRRLLLLKWLAGAIFSFLLVLCLGLAGAVFARLWFPWSGLFVFMPEAGIFSLFEPGEGAVRYAVAHGFLVLAAVSMMGCAFMFSCCNIKPAAATILALSFIFVNFVLQQIPYFAEYRPWFFTYHLNLWQFVFSEHIQWPVIWEKVSILAGFNVTFLVGGLAMFEVRDIKS